MWDPSGTQRDDVDDDDRQPAAPTSQQASNERNVAIDYGASAAVATFHC